MTKVLNIPQLVQTVRDLAAEHPHNYNEASVMFDEWGGPVCIMGHALYRLGVRDADLEGQHIFTVLRDEPELTVEGDVYGRDANWLHAVQQEADAETPWARSVQIVDAIMRNTELVDRLMRKEVP
jgi:hypothetical protein